MTVDLFYRVVGDGFPLIILHGVFGNSDNWLTLSKKLSENFKVISVDARNHGQSPHHELFNYEIMAYDLKQLLDTLNLKKVHLMGHSMGGKTAMIFAKLFPQYIDRLIIVDIAPKFYPVHHTHIIQAMQAINIEKIIKISDADDLLKTHLPLKSLRDFLLKNIKRVSDGYHWKINLPVIAANLNQIGIDTSDFNFDAPTLFIKGSDSDYIKEDDIEAIKTQFRIVKVVTIKNAGHWVQSEQPTAFLEVVNNFLLQLT